MNLDTCAYAYKSRRTSPSMRGNVGTGTQNLGPALKTQCDSSRRITAPRLWAQLPVLCKGRGACKTEPTYGEGKLMGNLGFRGRVAVSGHVRLTDQYTEHEHITATKTAEQSTCW